MQSPLYTYYIAKCDLTVPKLLSGTVIDSETGEWLAGNHNDYVAGLITINSYEPFFIKDSYKVTNSARIFFYDANESYISSVAIREYIDRLIIIPSDAKYYAIYVYAGNDSLKQFVLTKFIYRAHKASPIYKSLTKVIERETDQIFFREKLNGTITLKQDDYKLLVDSSLVDNYLFLIYWSRAQANIVSSSSFDSSFSSSFAVNSKVIKYSNSLYYKGSFKITDCSINYSKQAISIKNFITEDGYSTILSKLDNTYDLIKLAPKLTPITLYKRPIVQVYIAGASTITNCIAGTYWEYEVSEAVDDDSSLVNTYHFNRVKEYVEMGFSGNIFPATIITDEDTFQTSDTHNSGQLVGNWRLGFSDFYLQIRSSGYAYYYLEIRNSEGAIYYRCGSTTAGTYLKPGTWTLNEALMFYSGSFTKVSAPSNFPSSITLYTLGHRIYRRILLDSDITSITDSEGVKNTYEIASDDFAVGSTNYKRCIALTGGNYWTSTLTTTMPTKYGVNDAGEYFTDDFIPSSSGASQMRLIPISRSAWGNISIWMEYSSLASYSTESGIADFEEQCTKAYTLRDSYKVSDVIKVILSQVDPSISVSGIANHGFLSAMPKPITGDYFDIYITQRTNVLKGEYDQPAQKAEITLGKLLGMLRTCFNCYWSISNGNFEVEHKSYYDKGRTYSEIVATEVDLTQKNDQFNKQPALYAQEEKSYDLSGLYSRLEMSWPDESTELFGPLHATPTSDYADNSDVKTLISDAIATDIDYMLANPSAFSEDGFAMICAQNNNTPIIEKAYKTDTDKNYIARIQNYYASWPYLLNFHLTDSPSTVLYCDEPIRGNIDAKSLVPIEVQSVRFPYPLDPSMFKVIITDIGIGHPQKCEVNLDTRQCEIDLKFDRNE